ncbi:hypothetical protein BJ546DRAFT_856680 [Cryomyces antarcticus]|uniref:Transmembrane protein n=1 Tax=Cryomyces antarcticus TaxID=329879 RepID=A0ABR0LXY3_9PEZI|nr:hypothetical protein LTR39_002389 [Cryomyces antarcticus]KAK5256380.1 hypothetical protein LTR16_003382 [Cryomyces antarcticus]
MSSDSFAILRKHAGPDLTALAEEHMKHDLQQSDRETLQKAASKLSTYAAIGSVIGLGLGIWAAYRIRSTRAAMFSAFRAAEKPTHVQFAGGRTEAIPDITPLLQPTALGDYATYFFFSLGGLFLGGETGALTGSIAANRTITRDPESRKRIETAFRRFRADVLRKQAETLERGAEGNVLSM